MDKQSQNPKRQNNRSRRENHQKYRRSQELRDELMVEQLKYIKLRQARIHEVIATKRRNTKIVESVLIGFVALIFLGAIVNLIAEISK